MDKSPITPEEADAYVTFCRSLTKINADATQIRSKNGVLFEIVGPTGRVRKIGVDYKKGVFYFDGNRLGKRKRAVAMALYSGDALPEGFEPNRVWRKIQKQGF